MKEKGNKRGTKGDTNIEGKAKVEPISSYEGPEGEQWYSCTLSLTSGYMCLGGECYVPAASDRRKGLGTYHTGVWVGPRDGLDWCGKSR